MITECLFRVTFWWTIENGMLVWYSEIWSVINRTAVMCCSTQQKQKSRVPAAQGCRLLGLRQSRNVTQPQPMEAHTLTRIETYQLHCCFGVETQRACIWWNLGSTCLHTAACGKIISLLRLSWGKRGTVRFIGASTYTTTMVYPPLT